MRGFGFIKDALRVKVFKNSESFFDYEAQLSEELLTINNDIHGGETKVLFKLGPNDVTLLNTTDECPKGGIKLCTIKNEKSSTNPEGKWKILIESKTVPGGMAVQVNEVKQLLMQQTKDLEDGDCLCFGLKEEFVIKQGKKNIDKSEVSFIKVSGVTKKGYSKELIFDPNEKGNDKKIGSGENSDIILGSKFDSHYATLKLAEESVFADPNVMFQIENLSRYGIIIKRKKDFAMEPNTMEVFQIGNLLVQISRY